MTVGKLIEELKKYPMDMDVFLEQNDMSFDVSMLEEVKKETVTFSEGNKKKEPKAELSVLILKDY